MRTPPHPLSPTTAPLTPDPSPLTPLEAYVARLGGKRPIRKVLIANNGIAAVKAIRSIRRWSYEAFGNERAIEFVSMATPEDVSANAEYVRMADIWTSVPGGSNNHNFANVDLISDLADRFSCDAVWAGWGHASENPALPAKLATLGIIFLGPNPKSMHALGDKIASTIIAQSAKVPTVEWSGSGLAVDYRAEGAVPDHIYNKACVLSADHAKRVASQCGYPLVVKASEGGGGKGIRVVHEESSICAAYRHVASEVPGSPIFLMRLVQNARHLEVQIVADEAGDAIALYGRDCSVQRRHQKIIEEGPVVAAPRHVWKGLEKAAISLAKEVGYVGAGTVEYLYKGDKENGEFYFLELNPRLQVEHPVTEWITGVNLPALQLHIGMGIPLKNVSSIRKFLGFSESVYPQDELLSPSVAPSSAIASSFQLSRNPPTGDTVSRILEPLGNDPIPPHGHVIACRVTAENPDEGFQPTSGAIQELTFRNTPNVWGYFSVGASGGVHEYADSQFGHLFAWGETRESSRRSLVLALKELSIRGDIQTTVEYLITLLEMKAFCENQIDTAWLDSLIADKVVAEKPPTDLAVVIGAVCQAHTQFTERAESFTKCLERGQLPPLDSSLVNFSIELIYEDVKYCFHVTRSDVSAFRVWLAGSMEQDGNNGESVLAEVRTLADGAKLVLANGHSHVCYAREETAGLRLSIDGKTCLFPKEYDPTTLCSSVNGKLVRYLVQNDDHIQVGQPYVELEVMKMYLTLSAPESGNITICSTEGTSVDTGDVIAKLELDDPSKVRRAEKFKGQLPLFADPQALGSKPHQLYLSARKGIQLLLRGFDARKSSIYEFMELIDDPRVCAGEIRESLSSLSGRIPTHVVSQVEGELNNMLTKCGVLDYGSVEEKKIQVGCFASTRSKDDTGKEKWTKQVKAVSTAVSNILGFCELLVEATELLEVASKYCRGTVFATSVANLLDEYLNVEKHFARRSGGAADALFSLRDGNKKDLSSIVEIAASHICLKKKNIVLLNFLDTLSRPASSAVLADENVHTAEFKSKLHELSQLYAPEYSDIALRARLILADLRRPHFHQRKRSIGEVLENISRAPLDEQVKEIQRMVGLGESILDVLVSYVLPSSESNVSLSVRRIAVQILLLRSYRAYEVSSLFVSAEDDVSHRSPLTVRWKFRFVAKESSTTNSMTDSTKNSNSHLGQMPRGLVSIDSADNLSQAPGGSECIADEPYRNGILVAFENWAAMDSKFDRILSEYAKGVSTSTVRYVNVMTILLRWDLSAPSPTKSMERQSSLTLEGNENIRDPFTSEAFVSQSLSEFCLANPSRRSLAEQVGLKSITFMVASSPTNESVTYPGFYTFRVRNDFKEDPIFRHIDPPMAFQLELSRLSNFAITRFGYPTRSVHVFFAQDKAISLKNGKVIVSPASNQRPPLIASVTKEDTLSGNVESASKDQRTSSEKIQSPEIPKVEESRRTSSDTKRPSRRPERDVDARFFVRAVIRQADVFCNSGDGGLVSMPEAERTFTEALDAVEMARCDRRFRRTDFNHIFLNVIPPVQIDIDDVEAICRRMFQRYANRCWSLRVFGVEIKVSALIDDKTSTAIIPLRFLLFNPTGHVLKVESYVESTDRKSGVEKLISVSQDSPGSLHGTLLSAPYRVMDRIQRRRVVAQALETTYVYDFLHIFNRQLHQLWRRYSENRLLGGFHRHKIPITLIETSELILDNISSNEKLREMVKTSRKAGLNDIGMVAWQCTLYTPEYPKGREVIIIANDITFRSGSFGPEEDALFYAASKLSREKGIPRIYLAANSGARIGVAEEVRERLEVDWVDSNVPTKGFKSLALNESDLQSVSSSVKVGKKIGKSLWEITDVIGTEHGIGVENLMGSGLIAGETSRAYEETFTITYVSSRTVGIGAYLVRLGQRVIQKATAAPIILTGHSALNKVLGHDVYVSNEQLGGTKVMHPNGVTHSVVTDDVAGVGAILGWLSYVPRIRGDPLPIVESRDPVFRPITARPPPGGQPYDPRTKLIGGEVNSCGGENRFLSGIFDKDSWVEYLEGWAKSVIVGRARLGGVPLGIVAVETRSVERITPADPAAPETREDVVMQAGQVWYPDSASKTAQAIKDFDREGLPLFILANWRGFSGGMRDMFDEVLKSGSLIVDALRCYKQPVFVYIPPGGELRGGAWVVLDTLINPEAIEMYADSTSRGGVLEPEGTVDIKYRRRNIIKTMHRLDPKLRELDQELIDGKQSGGVLSDERKQAIHDAIYAREVAILPVYRNVATSFCDLHDTPGRLLAKGAVRGIVDWKEARSFFYWRLQRRLTEGRVRQKCSEADPSLSNEKITNLLKKWAADYRMESGVNGVVDGEEVRSTVLSEDAIHGSFDYGDRWVFHWLEVEEDAIAKRIEKIKTGMIAMKVSESCSESREGFLDGIETSLRNCKSSTERDELVASIQEKIGIVTSRAVPISSSLGILGRLGKLGWDRERDMRKYSGDH